MANSISANKENIFFRFYLINFLFVKKILGNRYVYLIKLLKDLNIEEVCLSIKYVQKYKIKHNSGLT